MNKHFFNNHPLVSKIIILLFGVILINGLSVGTPVNAQASQTSVCQGVDVAGGGSGTGSGCSSNGEDLNSVISDVLNILSLVAGFIAVLMLIIGGIRYIVSGGNDQAVAGAKNAIIYALVGLAIVAMAQFVVHIVLGSVTAPAPKKK